MGGGVEGGQVGFGGVEVAQVLAGGLQAPVVGVGRAIAPSEAVGFGGGGYGRFGIARVAFDAGEEVEGVGVEQGVGYFSIIAFNC